MAVKAIRMSEIGEMGKIDPIVDLCSVWVSKIGLCISRDHDVVFKHVYRLEEHDAQFHVLDLIQRKLQQLLAKFVRVELEICDPILTT